MELSKIKKILEKHIRVNYPSQTAFAKELGVTRAMVNQVLRIENFPIPQNMLDRIGYERVTVYRKVRK